MNELEVKKVPFMGTELMAARDNDGQIWAGVRWMCDGIGLTKGQMQNERNRIREDKVLSKGERNLVLPTNGGQQNTLCLKGGEVVGASNDGYSETYAGSGRTAAQRLYDAAALYLAPTGLLYAGMGGCGCAGLY